MCIIIDNYAGVKLPEYIVSNSVEINSHGFAFYNLKTKKLTKTMKKDVMLKLLRQKVPYLAHCRKATVGAISKDNIHLFEVGEWLIAMNGTIEGLANSTKNDTKQLIEMLELVKPENIFKFLSFFEARFLLYNTVTGKKIKTGIWFKSHKVSFSKENVLDEAIYTQRLKWGKESKNFQYRYPSTYYSDYDHSSAWPKEKEIPQNSVIINNHQPSNNIKKQYGGKEYCVWEKDIWLMKKIPSDDNTLEKNISPKNTRRVYLAVYDNLKKGKPYHHLIGTNAFLYANGHTNGKYVMIKNGNDCYVLSDIDYIKGARIPVEVYSILETDYHNLKKSYCKMYKDKAQFIITTGKQSVICNMFFFPSENVDKSFDTVEYVREFV